MFYDAHGRPDPNGQFQLIAGKLSLKPGGRVGADMMFMDAKPTAADKPESLDEALRKRFAEMAEQQGTDVETLLAGLDRKKLDEIAAEVATGYINSFVGGVLAKHFTDDQRGRMKASAVTLATITRNRAIESQAAAAKSTVETGKTLRDRALADRYRTGASGSPATQNDQVVPAADTASIRDAAKSARYT